MGLVIEDDVSAGNLKVYAGNLSYETTDAQLHELFSQYGEVVSANVLMRGSRSMGYGIVTFTSEADAKRVPRRPRGSSSRRRGRPAGR